MLGINQDIEVLYRYLLVPVAVIKLYEYATDRAGGTGRVPAVNQAVCFVCLYIAIQ